MGSRTPNFAALEAAHKHCTGHREEIASSSACGCCLAVFKPGEILDWVDENEVTALCPNCGIDSVIGTASGFPADDRVFLTTMQKHWFEG
jgi:hypothetical protein